MKPHTRLIKKMWDIMHKFEMEGMIDTPNKFAASGDIKIGLTELEQAFKQEIKKDEPT